MTGHSGGYFLKALEAHSYEPKIRCIARLGSDTDALERSPLNLEIVRGSLEDQAFVNESMPGVREVMHISSIFHSEVVARGMAQASVRRAFFVHTTGIYSRFKEASREYQRIEASVRMILGPDVELTFLRPTMIYGRVADNNMIHFIRMIDRLPFLPVVYEGAPWCNL